jgi:hypothetical protein
VFDGRRFFVSAALAASGALIHSFLGERRVLIPLAQQGALPSTSLGDASQTMMMIRFTWHFLSVVAASLAVVFVGLATGVIGGGDWAVVRVLGVYFAIFGVLVLVLWRGRNFAWLMGLVCAGTIWLGTL